MSISADSCRPKRLSFFGIFMVWKLYFDTVFRFGLRPASMACQQTTNAVAYIYFNEHCYLCINYLDDFGGVASPGEAKYGFRKLKILLFELGLEDSPDKESPPSSTMIFLGLLYNTVAMTISVPEDKLEEI